MGNFLLSVLSGLIANALVEAAKHGYVRVGEKQREDLNKLVGAVQRSWSAGEQFEAGLGEAFRALAPIQAYNRFHCLFSDLCFRQAILKWMFAITEGDRKATVEELRSLSGSMLGTEWGDTAVKVLTHSFQTVVQSNTLLSGILNRADHGRLLEAAREIAHKVDLRCQDASQQLSCVLEEIAKLRTALASTAAEPTVARLRDEFERYTDNVLHDLRVELPIIGSIDRIEHSHALRLALDEQAILLLGEAGTGKTGVMARLAKELRIRGECVLFVPADGIATQFSGSCTVADLSKALGFERPLPDILGAVADAHGRVWLLVDQLDTVAGEPVGGAFIQLVKRMRGRTGCIVVAACRSYEAEFSTDVSTIKLPTLHVAELPPEEVCRCLEVLKLEPTADLVGMCGNLLNLSLLATLVQKGTFLSEVTVESQLWRALREHLAKRARASLLDFACDCAISAVCSPGGAFHTKAVAKADRLASFGVLTRLASGRYRFRHERLRNYFFAYDSVMRRQESLPSLLARVPVARSKTIVPWMVQIADGEAPQYLERLFAEAFDQSLVATTFPREALTHSLPLICNPAPSLGIAIWRIAVEQDDVCWRKGNLCSKVPENVAWAKAFWDAKIFDLAARTTADGMGREAAQSVLRLLPLLIRDHPILVLSWIESLGSRPPNLSAFMNALAASPSADIPAGVEKMLDWMQESTGTEIEPVIRLAERAVFLGYPELAERLALTATAPVMCESKFAGSRERLLAPRCRGAFMHMRHSVDIEAKPRLFGVPLHRLINIFREHIRSLEEMARDHGLSGCGDPFACWGGLRALLGRPEPERGEEWQEWYGALYEVAIGILKQDAQRGHRLIEELLRSPDLLEVRIGLDLLGSLRRAPQALLAEAKTRDYFKEPAAIGEAIRVLGRFLKRKDCRVAADLASHLHVAIDNLDRNRPKVLHFTFPLSKLERWAEDVALKRPSASVNDDLRAIARFILSLETSGCRMRSWSFSEVAEYCRLCVEQGCRPIGETTILTGRLAGHKDVDARAPFESLQVAADRLQDLVAKRFDVFFDAAVCEGSQWVLEPIGYVLVYGAQWRLDSHAQFLRAEERYHARLYRTRQWEELWGSPEELESKLRKSLRREKVPAPELIRVYERVISDSSPLAPAIRGQFAGFLAMLTYELPIGQLRPLLETLRANLRKLASCTDPGYVRSWCRPIRDLTHEPLSTSSIAVFGLVECAWRERFDGQNPVDVLVEHSQKAVNGPSNESLELTEEDRQAVVSALRLPPEARADVLRVLGLRFLELMVLDRPLVAGVLSVLIEEKDDASLQALGDQVGELKWAWVCYGFLRPLYERLLKSDKGVISGGCARHIVCAYLAGWEESQSEGGLFAGIRKICDDENRANLAEVVCDVYDELGKARSGWTRVKALWQLASDEAGPQTTRELAGFWRCLQQGRETIGDDETQVKLHVPESIETLAPLLEKTCASLASEPSYSTDKREAVARYLGSQCVGHETTAVRLLGLCLAAEGGGYASIVVDYCQEAREVLRNAVSVGGEARKLATQIIERHEVESDKSLAGLLL
jgi:hypothetical protein